MREIKSPIRVLQIIQGKHFGGAERVVQTLAENYTPDVVKPLICCFSPGLFAQKITQMGFDCHIVPMRSEIDLLRPLLKVVALIKSSRVDLIHTHTVRSNLIGRFAALLTGKPCVTHLHSPIMRDFADTKRCKRNEIVDALTRPLTKKFIAVSESLRQEMIQGGMNSDKITTIHNGIDTLRIRPFGSACRQQCNIMAEFKLPKKSITLALIALLRPRKGVDMLLRAFALVASEITAAHLLVIGSDDISEEPDYGEKLKRLACQLGLEKRVTFTGFRHDAIDILHQCDLMILPSLFGEGLPMVILEAMAAGTPVIASRVEGVPEIITENENGFLVNPGDVASLSHKILSVVHLGDRLNRVIENGRRTVETQFNARSQAQRTEKIYGEILSTR